ncbi:MAG: hypothetical protein M3619_31520 [Myxococcota bacterium]|nr:hypothetical protein [Myxococcota bacterium]
MASSTTPRRRKPRLRVSAPPTPQELVAAPELAILAALHDLIDLATRTLVAAHPEILGEPSYLRPLDSQARLAERLIQLASRLADEITRYHVATLAALHRPDTDNDLPF